MVPSSETIAYSSRRGFIAVMRNKNLLTLLAITLVTGLLTLPAQADAVYDKPLKIISIKPPQDSPYSPSPVSCSYYTDSMVYEVGIDGPSPGNASIFLRRPGGALPKCTLTPPQGGIELNSHGFSMDGRKGNFLIFEFNDPTGASKFAIFNAKTGQQLFTDGLGSRITYVALSQGLLHLYYNRGINSYEVINGGCSLITNSKDCWSRLIANGAIPRGAFAGPPTVTNCKGNYDKDPAGQRSSNPYDDPSLIAYDADLTLDIKGDAEVRPVGPLQCYPEP